MCLIRFAFKEDVCMHFRKMLCKILEQKNISNFLCIHTHQKHIKNENNEKNLSIIPLQKQYFFLFPKKKLIFLYYIFLNDLLAKSGQTNITEFVSIYGRNLVWGISCVFVYLQNEKCSFNGNLFYSFLKLKTGTNNQWKIVKFSCILFVLFFFSIRIFYNLQ